MMDVKFKLLWITSIIIISFCCGTPLMLGSFSLISKGMALRAISPPKYPGSELIDQERGGGSGGNWVRRTYHSPTQLDKILNFMKDHKTEFVPGKTPYSDGQAPAYYYSACAYETAWGRYFYSRGYYPCISVVIHPDEEKPSETRIEVEEWYPDP